MPNYNFWQGDRVRLRAMEPEDWQAFVQAQDSEIDRACYHIPFPKSQESARKWAHNSSLAEPQGDILRLVIENLNGEMVGNLNTHDCDPRHGTFSYGLAIIRQHWHKGYASEAIRLVLRYFFQELRYQKATVQIYAFNEASLKLHERLGFVHEGRLRRMHFTGGEFHDLTILGITREEFEATM